MLTPAFKGTAAVILAMLKVSLGQLKDLATRCGHDKVVAAAEHLDHCVAELQDCLLETR